MHESDGTTIITFVLKELATRTVRFAGFAPRRMRVFDDDFLQFPASKTRCVPGLIEKPLDLLLRHVANGPIQ